MTMSVEAIELPINTLWIDRIYSQRDVKKHPDFWGLLQRMKEPFGDDEDAEQNALTILRVKAHDFGIHSYEDIANVLNQQARWVYQELRHEGPEKGDWCFWYIGQEVLSDQLNTGSRPSRERLRMTLDYH